MQLNQPYTYVSAGELFGLTLNWALAHIEGKAEFGIKSVAGGVLVLWGDAEHLSEITVAYDTWAGGGSLYERLLTKGLLLQAVDEQYRERMPLFRASLTNWETVYRGGHPLVAAFRAYVAHIYAARQTGDLVAVPSELVALGNGDKEPL